MKRFATSALLVLLVAFPASSQEENPLSDFVGDRTWAGWAFQEENDLFAASNTDKYYTQGLRFTLTRNPDKNRPEVERFGRWFVGKFDNGFMPEQVWSIGIGQNIYTPDDITITTPQLNDRHWGAFLYLDNTLQLINKQETKRHVFELQAGIVGPAAGGRFAQATIHEIIDSAEPVGWPNQLKIEPGVNLIYELGGRKARKFGIVDADVQGNVGGSLGNVMTYATAGAVIRVGRHNTGFLNNALRATAAGNFDGQRPKLEYWVYAGAQGRLLAQNIFLDGGFFRSIPTEIEKEPFVYDLMTGFSVRYRRWRLTYNLVRRSREFTHPLAVGDGEQEFGSVVLSVERIFQ